MVSESRVLMDASPSPQLAELKQECLARGLEAKGNKQDLINRLQAYLEEHGGFPGPCGVRVLAFPPPPVGTFGAVGGGRAPRLRLLCGSADWECFAAALLLSSLFHQRGFS